MKRKITPPIIEEVEDEHRDLYKKRLMKSVAAFAGEYQSTFTRKLSSDYPTKDHLYELEMEMYGTVMSGQPEIGRSLVAIVNRYAAEIGLLGEPIDILELATERLRGIRPEDIQSMSEDQKTSTLASMAILEVVMDGLKSDLADTTNGKVVRRTFDSRQQGHGIKEQAS